MEIIEMMEMQPLDAFGSLLDRPSSDRPSHLNKIRLMEAGGK
jgi:hypothetical protein